LLSSFYSSQVRSSPRKFDTEPELYAAALRALMRRAHSIHEMREYLGRRADDNELVSSVVAKLRERTYLDDARYALDYARAHAQSRRQGRFRIARELRSRGVPDRHIEAAVDAVFAETDEAALVRARLQRRLAHIRGPLDRRKLASLYASLLRAGFPADTVRTEIRAATSASAADPPEASSPED
jgi:regulatory protein